MLPGDHRFVDPVIRATRWRPRELDACFGAPEPHGFAVRKQARSSVALLASTASRPTFVTIASRPSWQGGMARANHIFPKNGSKLFFARGLDRNSQVPPVGQITCVREFLSSPRAKNNLLPVVGNVWFVLAILPCQEGRLAIVTNVGWDAVDVSSATDERAASGR